MELKQQPSKGWDAVSSCCTSLSAGFGNIVEQTQTFQEGDLRQELLNDHFSHAYFGVAVAALCVG